MAFLFFLKKKVRKQQPSKTSQEILDRLNHYLNGDIEESVQFLVRFWEDQSHVFTYQEIRQILLDGTVSAQTLETWRQDYSKLVVNRMQSLWKDAMAAGAHGQPILDSLRSKNKVDFNSPSVLSWLKERGAQFVTASTQDQKDAIKAFLIGRERGIYTTAEIEKLIRPCIGLTRQQADANLKFYNNVKETLQKDHPRMKKERVEKKARDAAIKYAERQHRHRAQTIAQTEMAFAYNRGTHEAMKQAQAQNLMGVLEKRWITSGDRNVCEICRALNGEQICMEGNFGFKGRELFSGHKQTPPAHPRCACAVEYIEISPPVFRPTVEGKIIPIADEENLPQKESLARLNEEWQKIPRAHQKILESAVLAVNFIKEGNSRFDTNQSRLYLREDFAEGEAIHEMAHALETACEVWYDSRYLIALKRTLGEFDGLRDIIDDEETFVKPIERLDLPGILVSEYQGRVYEELDRYNIHGEFNYHILGEFFSEAYREFLQNPQHLKKKQPYIYDFIERVLGDGL